MRKERFLKYFYISLTVAGAIVLSILFFFLLFRFQDVKNSINNLIGILMPFIFGAVIAYLLTPLCNIFEKHLFALFKKFMKSKERAFKASSILAIVFSFGIAILACYLLLSMVFPQVYQSIRSIVYLLPANVEKWTEWMEGFMNENQVLINYLEQFSEDINDYLNNFLKYTVLPNLEIMLSGVSSSVISALVLLKNLLVGMIAAIYLIGSRRRFAAQGKKVIYSIFKVSHANAIIDEVHFIDKVFGGFITGKLLDSLIIGCICFVVLSIMNMPYVMLISLIVGVTNIIPFFGPFLGAIPSALLILMVNPRQCVYFLIFVLILQQFDGNILGPKVLGDSTGLSSFWVLFSILLFGGMWGFIGMLIGVPLFAVIYNLVKRMVEWSLKRRELSSNTLDYWRLQKIEAGDEPEYVYEKGRDKALKRELPNASKENTDDSGN